MFNLLTYRDNSGKINWRWSGTGSLFSERPNWRQGIVPVTKAKALVEKDRSKVYCFVITTDDNLLIENCSRMHAYICEKSEGKELINYNTSSPKTQKY